jgi:hypothetical protein
MRRNSTNQLPTLTSSRMGMEMEMEMEMEIDDVYSCSKNLRPVSPARVHVCLGLA